MRSVIIVMATMLGLAATAGTASAQSFAPRCNTCAACAGWNKYSGHCFYPQCQRPIPSDPWANRGRAGNGYGQGEGFQWHPYLRSPRDFWMLPIP
jgi:hypothetical protein